MARRRCFRLASVAMRATAAIAGLAFAAGLSTVSAAPTTLYEDRASFLSAVGPAITDGYTDPGYAEAADIQGVLTDAAMSAVLGQTTYRAITFPNQNQVGDVFVYGDGSNYCSGCNGNFQLGFEETSLTVGQGVFGVALDFVLHTSRSSSIGDVIEGQVSLPGTIRVVFGSGAFEDYSIPADVGFFGPAPYFFGLTDNRGISSIIIGTEPSALRHLWVIDNLTIASRQTPEPGSLLLLALGLAGVALTRRCKQYRSSSLA